MSTASFIAKRLYALQHGKEHISRPAMVVAAIGVAVGVAVMLVTVSVALGFKQEIRSKVLSQQGHIQILNYHSLSSQESHPVQIDDDILQTVLSHPDVTTAQRFVIKAGMFKTATAFHGFQLLGIEGIDTTFSMSEMMARQLCVHTGDKINAYFFDNNIRARRFTIDTLYATHMEQFDNRIARAPYDVIHQLANWPEEHCSGLRIFTTGQRDMSDIAYELSQSLSAYALDRELVVITAEELSPQVFAWLSLLDTNVWIILCLMLSVASFTMVSGLLTLILERTHFVALMKAMGATNSLVHRVFLHLATMLLLRAVACGCAIGLSLLALQDRFHIIHINPADYYVDTVPVAFPWGYFVAVIAGTLLISVTSLLLPATLVAHIRPASSIKAE